MDALYATAPGTWCFCRRPEPPLNPRECGNCGRYSDPNIRNRSHQCESYGSLELRVVYSLARQGIPVRIPGTGMSTTRGRPLAERGRCFAVSCGCEKTLAGLSHHLANNS